MLIIQGPLQVAGGGVSTPGFKTERISNGFSIVSSLIRVVG
jgi:hypothetical protein